MPQQKFGWPHITILVCLCPLDGQSHRFQNRTPCNLSAWFFNQNDLTKFPKVYFGFLKGSVPFQNIMKDMSKIFQYRLLALIGLIVKRPSSWLAPLPFFGVVERLVLLTPSEKPWELLFGGAWTNVLALAEAWCCIRKGFGFLPSGGCEKFDCALKGY